MNRRIDLYTIGWALMGLLLLGIFTLNSATATEKIDADPFSYDRGGAAGFVELLATAGYHVDVDSSLNPALRSGDLAVAFAPAEQKPTQDNAGTSQSDMDKSAEVAQRRVRESRDGGGSILWMPVGAKVEALEEKTIQSFHGARTFPKTIAFGSVHSPETFPEAKDQLPVGEIQGGPPVAHLLRIGDGLAVVPVSGEIGLNYAIGKAENARVLLRLVGILAKPGSRVVFTTATMQGGEPPSFFEAIGPWALAAWKQLLLLLIVIAITLGSRFGLPDVERRSEQGSRELVEALGNIYERARSVDAGLSATLHRAEARIARRLKLSAHADLDAHLDQLPPTLVKQLQEIRAMIGLRPDAVFAVTAAAKLDRETDAFVGHAVRGRRPQ